MDITTLGAAVAMAKKVMPQVTAADAGKLATVDSNGKWAAADLEVGQGEVAVDSTLLVSGAAADAKVAGDKVNELKSALNTSVKDITGQTIIEYTDGYYVKSVADGETMDFTNLISSNDYRYAIIPCSSGDKFTLSIHGGGTTVRGYLFTDSNKVVLYTSDSSINVTDLLVTAPENSAYIVINDKSGRQSYVGKSRISNIESEIDDIEATLSDTAPLDLYKRIQFEHGSYKNIGNWSSGLNDTETRIHGQVTLQEVVYNITINPTNASYNYEYALFDASNNKIIASTDWVSQTLNYVSNIGIKTVRVDIRKTNNSNIATTADTGVIIAVNNAVNVEQINTRLSEAFKDINFNAPLTKLTVMSHNVGKFNYGNSGGYSGADVNQKVLDWKFMFGKYKPDILLGQENVLYFDANQSISPKTVLFDPLWPNYSSNGTYATFVRSKIPIMNEWDIDLTATIVGESVTRNARCCTISIAGKNIVIVSTHLSPNRSGYPTESEQARMTEAEQLITALSDYPYVIIGGDFNSSEEALFNLFKTDGYTCVNHGYWGALDTLNGESIDNIIVKGIVPYNIICNSADACTSDHYPVISELYIQ